MGQAAAAVRPLRDAERSHPLYRSSPSAEHPFTAFTVPLLIVLDGALLMRFLRRWLQVAIGLFDNFVSRLPETPRGPASDAPTVATLAEPGSATLGWRWALVAAREVAGLWRTKYHSPSMTRAARNLTLLTLAAALIALLLILGPNLQRIELAPGQPTPAAPAPVETVAPDLGTTPTGSGALVILLRVLFVAALACLAFIVIGALFKKELRRYLISFVILVGLIIGGYYLLKSTINPMPIEPEIEESTLGFRIDNQPARVIEDDTTPPPGWTFTAAAIAISLGVAVLVAILAAVLLPRWRQRAKPLAPSELDELVDTVATAADEIQLGGDARTAVLRCYREMVRIVCQRQAINHAHMTARELAAALRRAGFGTQHVDQLTEVFELVRYGNRSGRSLANRAVVCLEAIREAYAT